jgi:hypothetical protein
MKFNIILLFFLAIGSVSVAQERAKYKIKVVEKPRKVTRGVFYAATDNGLTLIKNNGDTIHLDAAQIRALYIHRRGIVAPLTIAGAAVFVGLAIAAKDDDALTQAALLIVGVPIGASIGMLAGDLIANKRYYTQLKPVDFPLIKADLQKYTVVK